MSSGPDFVFVAAKFAARAHLGQIRKDGQTPYVAHPMRVCLTVSLVFGINDPEMAAALLHDTIEDTTTDYDDIVEYFGQRVATFVQAMTKDKRLPDAEREETYVEQLRAGGWPVYIIKLADIYDNLSDLEGVSPEKRKRSMARARFYLDRMKSIMTAETKHAFEIVSSRLEQAERTT